MKKASINFTFLYKKYPGQWVALANDEKDRISCRKTAKEVLNTTKTNKKTHQFFIGSHQKFLFQLIFPRIKHAVFL